MSQRCKECSGTGEITWLDFCGCCMSSKYCGCPKGIEKKAEDVAVREFKAQRKAELDQKGDTP